MEGSRRWREVDQGNLPRSFGENAAKASTVSLRYLVDTDWVIQYLNADAKTVADLDARRSAGIAISVISLAELYEGAYYARDPGASEQKLRVLS
jgi:hypothetical protein